MKYTVSVTRSISVDIEVEADDPEEAIATVNDQNFELPPRDEWAGDDDWLFTVFDKEGNELASS
jgi:hypothetical protein